VRPRGPELAGPTWQGLHNTLLLMRAPVINPSFLFLPSPSVPPRPVDVVTLAIVTVNRAGVDTGGLLCVMGGGEVGTDLLAGLSSVSLHVFLSLSSFFIVFASLFPLLVCLFLHSWSLFQSGTAPIVGLYCLYFCFVATHWAHATPSAPCGLPCIASDA